MLIGFWYILLLLIGLMLFITGITRNSVSKEIKMVILLIAFGILFIFAALILLLPGSSEILTTLLGI